MDGFKKFQSAMLEAATTVLRPIAEKPTKEYADAFYNELFDLPGPREVNEVRTPRELYFGRIFKAFMEIMSCLETLDDIEFYVGHFPFASTRISRDRYLQFHVEAYFAELYMLQQRLDTYVVLLERQFRKDNRFATVRDRCKHLPSLVRKALENQLRLRHGHVHESRFRDIGIERIKTMGLLMLSEDERMSGIMRIYYRLEHAKVRKKWKKTLADNNKYVRRILNVFFAHFFPVVFEADGSLVYPSNLAA